MGLFVAGACFILPASVIVGALAWTYVRFGSLPAAEAPLYGMKPVVIVVVLQAIVGLGRTAMTRWALAALCGASGVAFLLGTHELLVLAGAAAVIHPPLWAIFAVFLKIGAVLFGSG